MNKNLGKHRSKYLQISIVVIVLLAITAVFIRNNTDIFFSPQKPRDMSGRETLVNKSPVKRQKTAQKPLEAVTESLPAPAPVEHPAVEADRQPVERAEPVKNTTEQTASFLAVEVHDIYCALSGRDDLTVVISLKFLCRGEELRQEILLKREDLKVVVRKVLAPMKLSEIVVEQLRTRIRTEANALLVKGTIEDIEFTKFQPLL